MSLEQGSEQQATPIAASDSSGNTPKFVIIFVVLAALAIAEVVTLSKMSSLRTDLQNEQAQALKETTAQIQERLTSTINDIQRTNAQQIDAMKTMVDGATKRAGATSAQLRKTKTQLTQLEQQQQNDAEQLKQEISQKADAQQLTALSQDASATRADLDTTKKTVDGVRSDMGMMRSEFGTLIARNHDDIETLRKLGERDYYEFTLTRNKTEKVANVGLKLTKLNVKRHRYNLALTVDDVQVERKDRAQNEPIFFYAGGSKKPFEVVVNSVQSNTVKGYLSAPKGATEVAARSEGTR